MGAADSLVLGEFHRSVDERFRVSLPTELVQALGVGEAPCILAKERPGCLSLWNAEQWQTRMDEGIALVKAKIRAGKLDGRLNHVQMLGRLLSTRQQSVELSGRGRLLIPEGFRQFLEVEPGAAVVLVGAAICLEIWHPTAWLEYQRQRMPKFRQLFDQLSS